jgi:spore maturation protein CgeB
MLLSERPPIRIPHNFREGESAVFFDDTQELEEKLAYYLIHREESLAIARAGHEHFKRYHTGSARARQALAWIQRVIG